jgi:hypothetical protein
MTIEEFGELLVKFVTVRPASLPRRKPVIGCEIGHVESDGEPIEILIRHDAK